MTIELPGKSTVLGRIGMAAVGAVLLSACVQSKVPLLTDAKPLFGQKFQLHLYSTFVDGKAQEFHTTTYDWKKDRYVRASELGRDLTSFIAEPLQADDLIIQSTSEDGNPLNYWLARKLSEGVYLISRLSEEDLDATTRDTACAKDQPAGICMIGSHDQLITIARATAAKPVHPPDALAVLVGQ
jgi:hypothetical protein